jgi:hypothetical protein
VKGYLEKGSGDGDGGESVRENKLKMGWKNKKIKK